jgi:multidrug efflux system membrane fusion protein
VELELANEKNFPHKGVLDFLDNRVDPTTGTLRIRGVFQNPAPDRVLQPGFFARVRVPGSAKYEATLVPAVAIGTDQGQKFVYIVNGKDEIEYRKVEPGPEHEGMRVIRSGLKADDWVVVNGLMSARPGVKVSPKKIAAGTPVTAPAEAKNQ